MSDNLHQCFNLVGVGGLDKIWSDIFERFEKNVRAYKSNEMDNGLHIEVYAFVNVWLFSKPWHIVWLFDKLGSTVGILNLMIFTSFDLYKFDVVDGSMVHKW